SLLLGQRGEERLAELLDGQGQRRGKGAAPLHRFETASEMRIGQRQLQAAVAVSAGRCEDGDVVAARVTGADQELEVEIVHDWVDGSVLPLPSFERAQSRLYRCRAKALRALSDQPGPLLPHRPMCGRSRAATLAA